MGIEFVEVKKWFKSKAINGSLTSILGVLALVAQMSGYDVGPVEEWHAAILAVVGAVMSIYGRIVAVTRIG